jgi:dTDP-glucose 4,6-dehydratase
MEVIGLARHSDQKNLARLQPIMDGEEGEYFPNFKMIYGDLNDGNLTEALEGVDIVFNFAAKTFVDHSVRDPKPFIESNIIGTYNLLEAVRKNPVSLFVQISTDEVYGACQGEAHKEDSPLNPTNPYSSTKAAADVMCQGYSETFGIPMLITRTENNYGPYQHPQKVIPVFVKKALADQKLPMYGDGKQRRMWLRVEDHCDAIWHLVSRGETGIYHIAGGDEMENIELAKLILDTLGKPHSLIEHIDDSKIRPNHDSAYALNTDKLRATGWSPKFDSRGGIVDTVSWFAQNKWWLI